MMSIYDRSIIIFFLELLTNSCTYKESIHATIESIQCIKHTLKLLTTLTLSLVVILIVTLSGSPFDCDCLVALLSVTLPGSRVCIVVRWYKKYIMYVSY